jgi:methyl-accepting chemotaxis protein
MADQELIVKIGAKIDGLINNLKASEERIRAFGKVAQDIGKSLTKNVTAPIAAIGTAAFAASVRLGNFADTLLDLEQQTGLSTDSLQEYRQVAVKAGIATDAVANASQNLQRRLASGEEGSKDLTDGLNALGISARDAQGNLRSIDKIVEESISKLSDYSDITERNQLALKIFGRSAGELAPLLALGSKEIENAKNQARELGLVLSKEALEAANEFRIAFDTLKATVSGVTNEIGAAFLPVAQKFVAILQNKILPVIREVINFFSNLSDRTKTTITVIAGVVAAIGPLLFSLGALTKAIPFVLAGLNAIKLAFVLISGPIGLIGIAIAGLAVLVVQNWDIIKKTIEDSGIVDAFKEIVKNVKELALVLATNFKTSFDSAKDSISKLFNTIKPFTEYIKDQFIKQIKFLADITAQAFGFIADLVRGDFSSAFLRLEIILLSIFKRITEAIAPLLEFIGLGGKLDTVIERLDARIANNQAVLAGREAFRNYKDEIADTTTQVEKLTGALESTKTATKLTFDEYSKLADIANEKVFLKFAEDARIFNQELNESIAFTDRLGKAFKNLLNKNQLTGQFDEFGNLVEGSLRRVFSLTGDTDIPDFGDLTEGLGEPVKEFADVIESTFEKVKFNISDLQGAFSGLGNLIGSVFNNIPLGSFLGQFASFVTQVVSGAFAVAKANAIAGATKSSLFTGPAAVFTLPAFIASAVGLVASAFAGIKGGGGGGSGISTSGVGSGVGSSFGGATGGAFDFNRQVELVGEFSVSGDQLKYVIANSNNFEN